jgi:DNA mismatch repair protein MSH2
VELFFLDTELRDRLRSQLLRGIPDLQRLSLRFQKGQARGSGSRGEGTAKGGPGLDEVMAFFRLAVAQGPRICEALEEFADSHPEYQSSVAVEPEASAAAASASGPAGGPLARPVLARLRADFIAPLQTHLSSLSPFVAMVEQAVLVSEQLGYNGQVRVAYSINPLIHPRLEEIAAAQSAAKAAVDAEAAAIQSAVSAASNQAVQPKLAHSDAHGFHLRLTKTEERKFSRGEGMGLGVGAVRLIESRKDGLHFSTRRLEKLAHAHAQLSADFAAASQQLLGDVVATTATYTPVLDALAGIVAALDTFSTLAHVAASASQPWVRPTMLPMGSGRIEIKQARHACMEHSCATASGGGGQFIPNDASMLRGESHLQIITGPNMGGQQPRHNCILGTNPAQ